jgi:hypothetical protein
MIEEINNTYCYTYSLKFLHFRINSSQTCTLVNDCERENTEINRVSSQTNSVHRGGIRSKKND